MTVNADLSSVSNGSVLLPTLDYLLNVALPDISLFFFYRFRPSRSHLSNLRHFQPSSISFWIAILDEIEITKRSGDNGPTALKTGKTAQ